MKPKILRTYNSVWKVEKVLYGIQDIPLPFPLTYKQIGLFSGGVFIIWILSPHVRNRYKEVSDRKRPYKYVSNVGYRQLSYRKRGETND